ncbi:MAG: hypothetical protein ACO217_07635, partial [Ilumatobacteraceae bacterium]
TTRDVFFWIACSRRIAEARQLAFGRARTIVIAIGCCSQRSHPIDKRASHHDYKNHAAKAE